MQSHLSAKGAMRPAPARARRAAEILRSDLPASLVVFLVAVPLSMGIALASGAPILSGLIAAAIGGIVVGALAGAPLQVSGPAAGLTVIVYGQIQQYGFAAVCAIVAAAGLVQLAFGALRVARLSLAISPAVIHAMMAGIGILITLGQLHVVLGGGPQSSAYRNIIELPGQIASLHGAATLLGLATIALLVLWPYAPRRLRVLPAPLVAVALPTLASVLLGLDVPRVKLPDSLLGGAHLPHLPQGSMLGVVGAVLTLALVASAESLLCAVATDRLHSGPRADLNRELVAQGAGNLVSGLLGGLPITGVVVRSTANITAGGRTRVSALLHGVWVLLFVTQLGFIVRQIPLSVLAALLCFVGARLVNLGHLRELLRHGEGPVYLATLLGVLCVNLLAGIGIGVAVAVGRLLVRLGRVRVRVEQNGGRYRLEVRGALTFVGVPRLSAQLAAIPPGAPVDVELKVDYIDHAGLDALHGWRVSHEGTGGRVAIELDGLAHVDGLAGHVRASPAAA